MSELFQAYYNGIPYGLIIGFTAYMFGYGVSSFFRFLRVGTGIEEL